MSYSTATNSAAAVPFSSQYDDVERAILRFKKHQQHRMIQRTNSLHYVRSQQSSPSPSPSIQQQQNAYMQQVQAQQQRAVVSCSQQQVHQPVAAGYQFQHYQNYQSGTNSQPQQQFIPTLRSNTSISSSSSSSNISSGTTNSSSSTSSSFSDASVNSKNLMNRGSMMPSMIPNDLFNDSDFNSKRTNTSTATATNMFAGANAGFSSLNTSYSTLNNASVSTITPSTNAFAGGVMGSSGSGNVDIVNDAGSFGLFNKNIWGGNNVAGGYGMSVWG